MTFCIGAQPHRAPPSTPHHSGSLGCVLALARITATDAADAAGHVELPNLHHIQEDSP